MIIFSKEFDCTSFPHCPYSLKEVLNYAFFTAMNTQAVFNLWESVEKTSDFWMILSNEQRAVLGSAKEVLRLSKGESVFRQGEEAQQLFYIKSGTVTESRTGGAGKPQILRFVGKGEIFGYGAALSDETYVFSAEAFEDCEIWALPLNSLRHMFLHSPDISHYVLHSLASELGTAYCRLVSLTQGHLRGRMAETLLLLHRINFTDDEHLDILSHLTRRELASLSNMNTSNAIRTLSQLAEEGLISVDGRNIRLLDITRLQLVALQG